MTSVPSSLKPGKGKDGDADNDRAQGDEKGEDSGSGGSRAKNSHIIEEFIDVGVPHRVAYDQWTQYDAWSKVFKKESAKTGEKDQGDGGRGGKDDDDRKVTVTAKIGPSQRQWDTEIVERVPGRRIAWRAKGGIQAKGVVTFHRLDDRLTYLTVNIEYKPSGFMETVGNFFRMQRRRVRKDLKLFKNYIELRGEATGKGPGRVRGKGLRDDVDDQVDNVQGDDKEKDQEQGDEDREQ